MPKILGTQTFSWGGKVDHLRSDPVDHARTTRRHAGETFKHAANAPGLAGVAVAVVALIVGLFALATGHAVAGFVAVIVAAVCGAAGCAWLLRTHRRVREAEVRWEATNYDRPAPPPSS
jgi:protein-S-isoprenylcysteine O-methyltransferase Ste14